MGKDSKIEWTDATWNPIRGCIRVSEGCRNCYAERMAARFSDEGQPYHGLAKRTKAGPRWTGEVRLIEEHLNEPLKWKKPRNVFVNSMSDLFHEKVSLANIQRIFNVMNAAHWHQFQILTKRHQRLVDISPRMLPCIVPVLKWSKNIWMGVSVEDENNLDRIDALRYTGAHIKFLSLEPLLAPLPNLNLTNIDWVIVGGESGPGARPMHPDWVRDIREQCANAGVPFFFKQWGGVHKSKAGRLLDGQTYDEMPKTENRRCR